MSRYPRGLLFTTTEDIVYHDDEDNKMILPKDSLVKTVGPLPYGPYTVKTHGGLKPITIEGLLQHQLKLDVISLGCTLSSRSQKLNDKLDTENIQIMIFAGDVLRNLAVRNEYLEKVNEQTQEFAYKIRKD